MKRIYTINEFDELYGIGRSKIYEEITEGRIKSVMVGTKRMVRHDDAEEWLASLPEVKRP